MHRVLCKLMTAGAAAGVVLIATGCSAPARTSRLTVADMEEVSVAMSQSLLQSETIRSRTRESAPWVVAMNRVENLSSDVITVSERWSMMQGLQNELSLSALANERNLTFVIAAEHLRHLQEQKDIDPGFGSGRAPTHQLGATIRSITRQADLHRTDAYIVEFRMTDIDSGQQVWSGEYPIKRAAFGRSWD